MDDLADVDGPPFSAHELRGAVLGRRVVQQVLQRLLRQRRLPVSARRLRHAPQVLREALPVPHVGTGRCPQRGLVGRRSRPCIRH